MVNEFESLRVVWSAADERFFRVVADVLPTAYVLGAGVLLASYDPEPVARPQDATPAPPPPPIPAPAPAPAHQAAG
jgi:hypothetical protein